MRRALVGGLSLSLGLAAGPAVGQERAATFGRPVAVTPAAPVVSGDPGVTPAGLFDRTAAPAPLPAPRPFTAVVAGSPTANVIPTPAPGTHRIFAQPGVPAAPQPMTAPAGSPMPTPMPGGARPGGQPSVTEMRDTPPVTNGGTPVAPGYGFPGYGVPVFPADPLLPSIGVPCGPEAGYPCPQPALDPPLFGGAVPTDAFGDPGFGGAMRSRRWLSAEYLMWWTKSATAPVLVTTAVGAPANPDAATLRSIFAPGTTAFKGILGDPTTVVLYGGDSLGRSLHSGGRFTMGTWFSDQQLWGIEGRMFFLNQTNQSFATDSSQYPVLARPFTAVNPGIGPPASEVLAFPGLSAGAITVDSQTQLWGAEAAFRRNLYAGCAASLDLLLGYRNVTLKERLSITETAVGLSPMVPTSVVTDNFRTENQFHGGLVGLAGTLQRGRWSVDGRASVAFGTMFQKAEIDGSQLVATGAGVQAFPGGLLALPGANIGTFTRSQFAVVPEVGVNVGYAISPRARLFVGYNLLYLSSVVRPGTVIDTGLDVTRIPNFMLNQPAGAAAGVRPAPALRGTDFWAQGINFGLSFNW